MKDRYRIKGTVTHPDPPLPPRPSKEIEITVSIKNTDEFRNVIYIIMSMLGNTDIDKDIRQHYSNMLVKVLKEV